MAVTITSFGKIIACGLLVVATTAFAPSTTPVQDSQPVGGNNSLCLDSMETVPDSDDLTAMPIADKTDGGCQKPSEPVAV
jgi:hypothetical protein